MKIIEIVVLRRTFVHRCRLVVQRLRDHNLKVKPKNVKLQYLSHIIENGTVRPNPNLNGPANFKQLLIIVLALPIFDFPFNIAADACEYGVGGVLSQ